MRVTSRRADGFVRLLSVFLGFVEVGLLRQIGGPEFFGNEFANLRQRVLRNVDGIRAHIGDQRNGAFVPEFDAFIKTLGDSHRIFCRITQAVIGGLLQL